MLMSFASTSVFAETLPDYGVKNVPKKNKEYSPYLDRRGSDAHPPACQGDSKDQIVMLSLSPYAVGVIGCRRDFYLEIQ